MNWTRAQRKSLIERYPYLQPRNIWTDKISKDYDYSYIVGESSVPEGWERLFYLFCKNIRAHLVATDKLSEFRFSDVKEKYGSLRLYNMGAPEIVHTMTTIYEAYSRYVCCKCGQTATIQTQGWISPFCDSCFNKICKYEKSKRIKHRKNCHVVYYDPKRGAYGVWFSFKELHKEYSTVKKLTDDEFYEYLMT